MELPKCKKVDEKHYLCCWSELYVNFIKDMYNFQSLAHTGNAFMFEGEDLFISACSKRVYGVKSGK